MSSIDVAINNLNEGGELIVLILALISIVFGGIGLMFNILVFARVTMRREPCALYFFGSTCFSLVYVIILQPVRASAVGFGIDQANYNLGICKIEFFIFYVARSGSAWLIVLACIDRFFHSSSNVHIRRLSSVKTAKKAIGIISIIIFLIHTHMLIFYEIGYSIDQYGNLTPACFGRKGIYRTFIGFWNLVLYSLGPSCLMLFFGLLTLNNLRNHRRIIPLSTVTNRNSRRTDAQLLRMLVAQVLVIFICTLPISVHQLFQSFTINVSKDSFRIAQETLSGRITSELTYYAHSNTFYLYTLAGTIFRKEFIKIIWSLRHRNGSIVPISTHPETR